MAIVAIVGAAPCRLAALATMAVHAPATEAPLVQELHQIVTHLLCDAIEEELAQRGAIAPPRSLTARDGTNGAREGDE
jgi:DNA-binding MurR/RpiR family transcriptional regulator